METISSLKVESEEARDALRFFNEKYPRTPSLFTITLLKLACEAVGGDSKTADSLAIPMILIRAGIDIHDDIIDKSTRKYGKTTIYGKFGKEIALLTGDALIFEGFFRLYKASEKVPKYKVMKILNVVKQLFVELGDAEALELKLRRRTDVTPEEYLHIVRKKAADVESLLRIGAILGSGSKKEIESLGNYGRTLGMLSLLVDDILDFRDPKELSQRVKNEGLPLPVIFALKKIGNKTKGLLSLSLKKELTQRDLNKILKRVDEAGGLRESMEVLDEIRSRGMDYIKALRSKRNEFGLILDALYVSGRDY